MVGDRWGDIEAGRRAGCRTILVGDGYGEEQKSTPDAIVATLGDAADWIIAQSGNGSNDMKIWINSKSASLLMVPTRKACLTSIIIPTSRASPPTRL